MKKFDTEWLIKTLKNKNIKATPLEKYINDSTPILFKCDVCGHIWKVDPSHLKNGRTCPNCKKLNKLEQNKKDFIQKATKIHNGKYDYSKVKYSTLKEKVTIICPIHGEFEQTPNSHLSGRGCPLCAENNIQKTTEQFIAQAIQIHNNAYDYTKVEYKHCKLPVIIKCNKCGLEFVQTPDKHLSGHVCPKCKLKSQNLLFEKLKKSFPNEEILFEVNKNTVSWLENLRFDIYFPKHNIAVEYNGILHYVPVKHFGGELSFENLKEKDILKYNKCILNNCALFIIKYNYSNDDYNILILNISNIIINGYKV